MTVIRHLRLLWHDFVAVALERIDRVYPFRRISLDEAEALLGIDGADDE